MNEHDVKVQKLKFYKQMSELIIKSPFFGVLKLILFVLTLMLGFGWIVLCAKPYPMLNINNNHYHYSQTTETQISESLEIPKDQ